MKATLTHFASGAVRTASRLCPKTPGGTGYHAEFESEPFARTAVCANCGLVWSAATQWTELHLQTDPTRSTVDGIR